MARRGQGDGQQIDQRDEDSQCAQTKCEIEDHLRRFHSSHAACPSLLPEPIAGQPLGGEMRAEDQDNPDDALEQAGCGGIGELAIDDADPIDIGVEDIDHADDRIVHHVKYLVEPCAHEEAQVQDEYGYNRAVQLRQGDVEHLLHAARSVDLRRLVQSRADPHDRRQIDDRVPSGAAPDLGDDEHPADMRLARHVIDRLVPEEVGDQVHRPLRRAEQLDPDAGDDDPAEEVRQIHDRLHILAEVAVRHLIHQQGQQDRHREAEEHLHRADDQRVAEDVHKCRRAEQHLEMLEPDPHIVPDDPVILEGETHPEDRDHVEDDEVGDGRRQHHIQDPVLSQLLQNIHRSPSSNGTSRFISGACCCAP